MASTKTADAALKSLDSGGVKLGTTFTDVGTASDRTAPKVHNLRTALTSFDGVLASMGVNIGTEVRGLTDLADASGKTFTQLGLVATAGLAAGAALGGWKLGRLISEFFELDKVIGNATAKMMGWGDLTGTTVSAQQDVVTRAIERGAAATITYTEALKFNDAWQKTRLGTFAADAAQMKLNAEEQKKLNIEAERWGLIMAELNSAGGNWAKTLEGMNGTVVEAVKFYLQAGVSQGTLAQAYALTATQVKAVATAMSEELAMAKVLNDFITTASANQAALDARAMASIEAKTKALRDATAQAIAFNEAFLAKELKTALAQDAINAAGGVDTSQMHSGQRGPGINQVLAESSKFRNTFSLGATLPHFASGGPVLRDGPIFAHAGEFVTPKGGAGTTVTNHIYVNGTADDVARQIADKIKRSLMQSTKLVPS